LSQRSVVDTVRSVSSAPSAQDDQELVARILAGDRGAFSELVKREHALLVRLARSILRDHALVDEVVQDAWLRVVGSLKSFEGRSSLRTWIGKIVVNRARTLGMRAARCVPMSALGSEGAEPEALPDAERFSARGFWRDAPTAWEHHDPEWLLARRELRESIESCLDHLPPGQRAVLTLRDLEGWTSEEVCNTLELSESNQRVLLHRARAKVRKALEVRLAER
jgi:RNA polymerase sigma-70 factor, ECF subfamily